MNRLSSLLLVVLTLSIGVTACGDDDAVGPVDAGSGVDAGRIDSGTLDAGADRTDAGTSFDAAAPVDTWSSFAEGFFATYCVECHSTSPKDFRLLADVRAFAPRIRCGTSDVTLATCTPTSPRAQQFPIGSGPFPSDAERARLVAWIDGGFAE